MNAREAYNLTLQGLETLKKEQLTEINARIEKRASQQGKFNYSPIGELYDEVKSDLIARGFKVKMINDEVRFVEISWGPDNLDINKKKI